MACITEQQRAILDSFYIERLSDSEENFRLVSDFQNSRSDSLTNKIQSEAFEEDELGTVAFYVIKNKEGKIVFYFSLKCGQLYDKLYEKDHVHLIQNLLQYFDQIEQEETTSESDLDLIEEIRESVRSRKGILKSDLNKIQKKDNKAVKDLEKAFTGNMQRVGQTFAGVEIVQFCLNDKYSEDLKRLGFFPSFGAIVFWHFLVPKVLEVRKHIGCHYLFLFAADTSEDESLIRYYKSLRFTDAGEHGAVIPLYDWTCRFMYQEISSLEEGQRSFFNDFNRDDDDV